MLCKAAVMGDCTSQGRILAADTPSEVKALGRSIKGWDAALWQEVVCSVGFEIVYQKFKKTPELREVLLMTGDVLIVEASEFDAIWGIGIGTKDARIRTPSQWQGATILGWALMEVRAALRAAAVLN